MAVARRAFLRSGAAVAIAAVADAGCSSLSVNPPPQSAAGWDQVPQILARIVPPPFPDRDFVVTDYGASGNGLVDCRPAFAAAIADCSQAGGGRVVVPAASEFYLVNGPIRLLGNVNLYLEAGSRVVFGTNPADYLPPVLIRYQGIRCYNYSPLIYAYGQSNIAITGAGSLEGQGFHWSDWVALAGADFAQLQQMVADGVPVEKRVFGAGHHLRLTMFEPYECRNVLLQGVTFRASPFWTIHPVFCTNVTIRDVTVSPGIENDDGCDPDSCSDVLIDGCTFSTHDDNISVKAGHGADAQGLPSCENIVIQNCNAAGGNWGGITLGSQTGSKVQSVFVQNCRVGPCSNAFFVKSSSAIGGAVNDVFIRSCLAAECGVFFRVQSDYGGYGKTPPLFSNINLEGIQCDAVKGTAFAIGGDERNPIVYIHLKDIAIGSAGRVQLVRNAFFITSSNVTIGGKPVTISGLF
ncbi:MAG TPA: glycoside hydrolase family 28 protein [Terracidiphilus sp.]|nr:glycoside hydrolase family 28 protein [Terracidiphilus sp.]